MIIERTDKEILIRYQGITSKSRATQEAFDTLADEVNRGWWDKNKDAFLPI